MWIDIGEAIKIYARVCQKRYGAGASSKVREKAHELEVIGDSEGSRIWDAVAREIDNPDSGPIAGHPSH
jgi:hypothetical protein